MDAERSTEQSGTDPYAMDWVQIAPRLAEAARDDGDWYAKLAGELLEPADRLAVDVGCGGAGMTAALAVTMSRHRAGGRVVAVDAEPAVLATARELVAGTVPDLPDRIVRIDFVQADLGDLGDGVGKLRAALDGPADLIWASASVHHLGDQQAAITGLAGLLAPGGRLALAEGGLPTRYLPWDVGTGAPGLEVRLNAAYDRWFTRMRASLPGSVPMPYGWTEALRRAGLSEVTTRTTLLENPAPLPDSQRDQIVERLARWVERLRDSGLIDEVDLAVWDRLLDPDDPAWLGRRTDLYRLAARSVHIGVRPSTPD